MKPNRQFIIPFKGLKVGQHDFNCEVGDAFFEEFPESEIKKGKVSVDIVLIKRTNLLEFHFNLSGEIWVECDRCLDEFLLPIEYNTTLYVKFGDETEEQTDEIILLSYNETEIDLAQYIYEFIHLSMPYRKVHPNDKKGNTTCNKEMIKKLEQYSITEDIEDNNPDWEELKKFLNNN